VKTVVMKRSDSEKKAAEENYAIPWQHPGGDDYPHGLRVSLDDGSLSRLGINQMPKPGDKYRIEGEAHVLGSEQRDTDQNSDRRVDLVLHELGVQPKPGNSATRQTSVREDLEDALHQARGTTAPGPGRIGARLN
jgi:hypothetical protein